MTWVPIIIIIFFYPRLTKLTLDTSFAREPESIFEIPQ